MIKKIGIPVLISLLIIGLCYSLIYVPFINSKNDYVIINDKDIFKITNNKWTKINKRNINRLSFSNSYSLIGDKFIGKTYLNSNKDNFEIYDSAYQKIDATDTLITLNTKKEIEDIKIAKQYNAFDDVDMQNVNNILKRYSLDDESFSVTLKYITDLNNDGEDDIIYSISNFYDQDNRSKAFSLIFSSINNNIEMIDEVIVDSADEYSTSTIYLKSVLDIDQDNNYELIISNASYGNDNNCYSIYRYDTGSNSFEKLIGC